MFLRPDRSASRRTTIASSLRQVRSQVTFDEIEGFRVTIPVEVTWGEGCGLAGGILTWSFLELVVVFMLIGALHGHRMVGGPSISVLALAAMVWTGAGCAFVFWMVPWADRRQVILIEGDQLVIRQVGVPAYGFSSYPLMRIRNLRYSTPVGVLGSISARSETLPFAVNIAFDYDQTTIRFGPGLSENECRRLIKTIKDRFKIPDGKDEPLPVERL